MLAALAVCGLPALARADGDPGSDVLVYQPLFVAADAHVSIADQLRLGGMLRSAAHAGAPIRVAIIARRDDLGSVTALWGRPRAYARFLGIELSLSYTGPLLVVMPDGFGVSWPGHSSAAALASVSGIRIGRDGAGLATAVQTAAQRIEAQRGVTLTPATVLRPGASHSARHPSSIPTITTGPPPAPRAAPPAGSWPGGAADQVIAVVAAVAFGLVVLAIVLHQAGLLRRLGPLRRSGPRRAVALAAGAPGPLACSPSRAPARRRWRSRERRRRTHLTRSPAGRSRAGGCRWRRWSERPRSLRCWSSAYRSAVGPVRRRSALNPSLDPGSALPRARPGFHADGPVRPSGLAAVVPRQGDAAGLQRLRVHDDLPADDDRDARGQADARSRRASRCSCSGSTPTRRRPRSRTCSATRSCTA